jgi:hypothetical protein
MAAVLFVELIMATQPQNYPGYDLKTSAGLKIISDYIATSFHLPAHKLGSKKRDQRTAFARQVAMYLCRKITESSFPSIGAHFNRDHSTVIHGCNLIARRTASERAFRATLQQFEDRLREDAAGRGIVFTPVWKSGPQLGRQEGAQTPAPQ